MNTELVGKYDRIADGFAESSYTNLAFYMERRLLVAKNWGRPLYAGDSVVELGCGDGYLAEMFAAQGLDYFGVDVSPGMVATAKRRLLKAGLEADFAVSNVDTFELSEPCDAVISFMRTFFTYVREPFGVLKRLRPFVRKKIIVDLDPRRDISISAAIALVTNAGFKNVRWRPFFVPEGRRLSASLLHTLVACEEIPVVRSFPLRWKFHVLLQGEVS